MNENITMFSGFAEDIGIKLNENQLLKLETYMDYLIEYNKHTNLTAVTEPSEIVIKHFLDSLLLCKVADIKENDSIIDIGTGAGFPGVPLKIAYPTIKLSLLDSLKKRLTFLEKLMQKLGIESDIMHKRAEEGARDNKLRERFDYAVSRAVAGMNVLVEYCLPYVKIGGYFIALKGPSVESEIEGSRKAIQALGGGEVKVQYFDLPNGMGKRSIVLIKKVSHTDKRYPRTSAKISKSPL